MHISCLSWAHNQWKKKNIIKWRKTSIHQHIESENKCIWVECGKITQYKNEKERERKKHTNEKRREKKILYRKKSHTTRISHIRSFSMEKRKTRRRKSLFRGVCLKQEKKYIAKREKEKHKRARGQKQKLERAKEIPKAAVRFWWLNMKQSNTF